MARYLGIDVGTTSVKAAVIRTAYRKVILDGLATVLIATNGDRAAAIAEAAQAALGAGSADAVATALPGTKLTLRTVRIPEAAQRQLADVLPFELEAVLPFDLSDAVIDWTILEGATNDEGLAVMAAVARVEDARQAIDTVKNAIGMEPERLGVGSFPIARLAPYSAALSGDRTVAVLDLGTKTSDLVFLQGGEPVFARSLSLGTEGLPQSAPKLAREIRLSLAAHRAQGGVAPDEMFLCGGGAYVSGSEAFLSGGARAPRSSAPAAVARARGRGRALHAQQLPLHAVSIGLALSLATRTGLDLRKRDRSRTSAVTVGSENGCRSSWGSAPSSP